MAFLNMVFCESENCDSFPMKPPAPSIRPKTFFVVDSSLTLTPEKNLKKIGLKKRKKEKKICFTESHNEPQENLLAKPILHTTNTLRNQLKECQNKEYDLSKILREVQLSDTVQTSINEELTPLLNYKLNDKKYTNLTSLDVEEEKPVTMVKHRAKPKLRDRRKEEFLKPDVMDLWCDEDFVTERPKIDIKVEFPWDIDKEDEIDNDKFDFLFDVYRHNECYPYHNDRT